MLVAHLDSQASPGAPLPALTRPNLPSLSPSSRYCALPALSPTRLPPALAPLPCWSAQPANHPTSLHFIALLHTALLSLAQLKIAMQTKPVHTVGEKV